MRCVLLWWGLVAILLTALAPAASAHPAVGRWHRARLRASEFRRRQDRARADPGLSRNTVRLAAAMFGPRGVVALDGLPPPDPRTDLLPDRVTASTGGGGASRSCIWPAAEPVDMARAPPRPGERTASTPRRRVEGRVRRIAPDALLGMVLRHRAVLVQLRSRAGDDDGSDEGSSDALPIRDRRPGYEAAAASTTLSCAAAAIQRFGGVAVSITVAAAAAGPRDDPARTLVEAYAAALRIPPWHLERPGGALVVITGGRRCVVPAFVPAFSCFDIASFIAGVTGGARGAAQHHNNNNNHNNNHNHNYHNQHQGHGGINAPQVPGAPAVPAVRVIESPEDLARFLATDLAGANDDRPAAVLGIFADPRSGAAEEFAAAATLATSLPLRAQFAVVDGVIGGTAHLLRALSLHSRRRRDRKNVTTPASLIAVVDPTRYGGAVSIMPLDARPYGATEIARWLREVTTVAPLLVEEVEERSSLMEHTADAVRPWVLVSLAGLDTGARDALARRFHAVAAAQHLPGDPCEPRHPTTSPVVGFIMVTHTMAKTTDAKGEKNVSGGDLGTWFGDGFTARRAPHTPWAAGLIFAAEPADGNTANSPLTIIVAPTAIPSVRALARLAAETRRQFISLERQRLVSLQDEHPAGINQRHGGQHNLHDQSTHHPNPRGVSPVATTQNPAPNRRVVGSVELVSMIDFPGVMLTVVDFFAIPAAGDAPSSDEKRARALAAACAELRCDHRGSPLQIVAFDTRAAAELPLPSLGTVPEGLWLFPGAMGLAGGVPADPRIDMARTTPDAIVAAVRRAVENIRTGGSVVAHGDPATSASPPKSEL
jgi:hypothetical protein